MSFALFQWPNGQCLGRQPCADTPWTSGRPCLQGCTNNPRWNDGFSARARDRELLRRGFGNYIIRDQATITTGGATSLVVVQGDGAQLINRDGVCGGVTGPGILTPFRRAMNAGDPYGTVNMVPNNTLVDRPSNQVQGSRRAANQAAASTAGNGLRTTTGGSAYTGNPRRVYDGSDYTRFKKLQAKNRNFNDPTFGGDDHNASQVPLSRVRM